MTEIPIVFECEGASLVGIISAPATPASVALLNIVGGPQYRVGSHRQFVHMTRMVAANGFAAMRFDVRGMGDSDGDQRTFEDTQADIAAAVDVLCVTLPRVRTIVLMGLCGGATAALLYWRANRDPRVKGMFLMNPWTRSEATLALTQVKHYYGQRLLEPEFWRKLMSGKVAKTAVVDLLGKIKLALTARTSLNVTGRANPESLSQRMVAGWLDFRGDVLLVLSGEDYTAKEFLENTELDPRWQKCIASELTTRIDMVGADHTFSHADMRARLEESAIEWLRLRFSTDLPRPAS